MSRVLLLHALLLGAGCGELSGLRDLARQPAELSGTGPAGAVVFLVGEDGQPARWQRADARGRFTFGPLPPGPVELLVNDLGGRGALLSAQLVGGQRLDLGDLAVAPLEAIDDVLELRGVGFEERLAEDRGDHRHASYASDASRVYTVRQLPGEPTVDLVVTETASGIAYPLRRGERLGGFLGYDEVVPVLFDDRYLVYTTARAVDEAGTVGDTWVVIDATAPEPEGEPAEVALSLRSGTGYVPKPTDQPPYSDRPVYLGDGLLAYVARVGGTVPHLGDPNAPDAPVLELCTVELDAALQLARKTGATAVGPRRCARLSATPRRVEYQGTRAYVLGPGQLGHYDLADAAPERRTYDSGGYEVDELSTTPAGLVLGISHPQLGAQLVLGDADGGELLGVVGAPEGTAFRFVVASPGRRRAVVRLGPLDRARGTFLEGPYRLVELDGTGGVETLPDRIELAGQSFAVGAYCRSWDTGPRAELPRSGLADCFTDDDHLWITLETTAEACEALTGHTCGALERVHVLRTLSTGELTIVPPSDLALPDPDGTRVAWLRRDDLTGHLQIRMTGLSGSAPGAERQVTFLSADHGSMRWSPDGRALYYFTRDPGRGYRGLFRLDVARLDELGAPEGSSP